MAKKPTRSRPKLAADNLTGEIIDHGIYRQYAGTRAFHTLEPSPWLFKTATNPFDLDDIRDWLLESFIKPQLLAPISDRKPVAGEEVVTIFPIDAPPWPTDGQPISYVVRREAPEPFWDAIAALVEVNTVHRAWNARDKINDPRLLIDHAIRLGKLLERLNVRKFERLTKIGRAKSRKSKRTAENTNKKKASRRPDYTFAVREAMAEGRLYSQACDVVASRFDCNERTVRNNTKDLQPRRQTS